MRSFRGVRVASSRRHQASIASASVCIAPANVENRSGASEGRTYIQCTGKPDSVFGLRSARAGVRTRSRLTVSKPD